MTKFSDEFISKLMHVYPACVDYHNMAIHGDNQLLTALNCMCDETITNEEIIECLEKGEEGRRNLYIKAKRLQEKLDIYFTALTEFEEQNQKAHDLND
jgi:hypothetical protein